MANHSNITIALTNDNETKTTAYNMGCGLVAIEQYDPEADRSNTVILTEQDLVQLKSLIS